MVQSVRTLVDGGAHTRKEKRLQDKKKIPGGKDPPTREQEKLRYRETRKEYTNEAQVQKFIQQARKSGQAEMGA